MESETLRRCCADFAQYSEQLAFGEIADEAEVGGQKVVFRQLPELHPSYLVEDMVLNFAREFAHREELQVHGAAMAVIVADMGDGRSDDRSDSQFLVEFAGERLLRGFAGLDFAPGELPFESHDLVGAALAYEYLAITNNECGRHKPERWAGLVRRRGRLGVVHRSSVNLPKRM